jgi:hypothetical protein
MTGEWQVWRCFDNIRETFEETGWEYGFVERNDNDVMPLLAEFSDPVVRDVRGGESAAKRYPYTGYGGGEVELPTVHLHPCQPDLPRCASVSIEA